jgi:hypothetical protein
MRFATAKHATDVKLKGVRVEFVSVDKAVKEIRLTDGENVVVFKCPSSYGDTVVALIPQPFEAQDRWHLTGTFGGLVAINEHFESEYDAKHRKGEYEAKASLTDLEITKVKVLVDDDGNVRGAVDPKAPVAEHGAAALVDDLPF